MDSTNPTKSSELLKVSKGLDNAQIDMLINLAKGLKK